MGSTTSVRGCTGSELDDYTARHHQDADLYRGFTEESLIIGGISLESIGARFGATQYRLENKMLVMVIGDYSRLKDKVALISRGGVASVQKAKMAQDAGAAAVIITDNVDGSLSPLPGEDEAIIIPVRMISKRDGEAVYPGAQVSMGQVDDRIAHTVASNRLLSFAQIPSNLRDKDSAYVQYFSEMDRFIAEWSVNKLDTKHAYEEVSALLSKIRSLGALDATNTQELMRQAGYDDRRRCQLEGMWRELERQHSEAPDLQKVAAETHERRRACTPRESWCL